MKKTLNTMAIAAAACLALGGAAKAGSMGYPENYSVNEYETGPTFSDAGQTVITTEPESVGERIVRFPGRAVRTAVTSPVIVGETISGRRAVVSDQGVLARTSGDRVYYREEDIRMRPARRLSSQRIVYRTESLPVRNETLGERIVRFPGRAVRTAVTSPVIVGETLSGRRAVVSDRGVFARTNGDRVYYREDIRTQPTRRLSSRRIVYRTGDTVAAGAETVGRGIVRTGRTVVRTPLIIGETMTGERRVINEEGRPFAR